MVRLQGLLKSAHAGPKGQTTFDSKTKIVLIDQGEVEKMGVLWNAINLDQLQCSHRCIIFMGFMRNLMV